MSEPVGNSPRGAIQGNSHKERASRPSAVEPRPETQKIIEGKVVQRKQPWWRKAARSMIADDAQDIGDFLLVDILVPAAKNLIHDIVVGGTDRTLYGGSVNSGRGRSVIGQRGGIRRRYDQMSEEPRRTISRESRARHDFDEIVLDSRDEAVAIIDGLLEWLERYGSVSVRDLYGFLGVSGGHADLMWGWTSLIGADVRQVRGGFLLDLPPTVPLRERS